MSISVLQTNIEGTTSSGSTVVATYTANVTAGNLLVALVGSGTATVAASTVSDTVNGAWTKAVGNLYASGQLDAGIWYFKGTAGAVKPQVTATWSGTQQFLEIVLFEIQSTNGWLSTIVDGTNSAQVASGTTASPGAITTTNATDILFSYAVVGNSVSSGATGWTYYTTSVNTDGAQYVIETATGSYTGSFSGGSGAWVVCAAAFAATGAPPTQTISPSGIASTVAFGTATVAIPGLISPAGIASSVALGTADVAGPIICTGIPSSVVFGNPTMLPPQPTMVQHVATAMDFLPINTFTITLPNVCGAGNCLILGIQFNSTGSVSSITDNNGSNTWVSGPTVTDSTHTRTLALYYALNVAAGTEKVVVHFSGLNTFRGGNYGNGYPQGVLSEWYNVALSSASDGSSSAVSKSAGSITTTANGDLIYQWGVDTQSTGATSGPGFNGTSITPGSGFSLLSADLQAGSCEQFQVQTLSASINPTFTTSGSDAWASVAIALKAAAGGAGTPRGAGIKVIGIQHTSICGINTSGAPVISSLQFPCFGNLLVSSNNWAGTGSITAVSDSSSNSWNVSNLVTGNGNNTGQFCYAANATASPSLSLHFTFSGTTNGPMMLLYDIVGAATAPFDTAANSTGTLSTSPSTITSVSLTPSTAGELVINNHVITWGSVTGATGTGNICDAVINDLASNNTGSLGTPNSCLDEDNGYAHQYSSSTSPVSFVYSLNNSGVASGGNATPGSWTSVSLAFLPIPVTAQTISPSGIASTLAIGSATIQAGAATIAPSGIVSTVALGTPTVLQGALISPSGIASSLLLGNPTLQAGAATIAPVGMYSTAVLGNPVMSGGIPAAPSQGLGIGIPFWGGGYVS